MSWLVANREMNHGPIVLPRHIESCWYVMVLELPSFDSMPIMFVVVSVRLYPIPSNTAAKVEKRPKLVLHTAMKKADMPSRRYPIVSFRLSAILSFG